MLAFDFRSVIDDHAPDEAKTALEKAAAATKVVNLMLAGLA
jgi:hypothetical protein